jgi:hypothetical protein
MRGGRAAVAPAIPRVNAIAISFSLVFRNPENATDSQNDAATGTALRVANDETSPTRLSDRQHLQFSNICRT